MKNGLMKRIMIALSGLIGLLLFSVVSYGVLFAPSPILQLDKQLELDQVVYTIQGEPITEHHMIVARALVQSRHDRLHDGKTSTEDEALSVLLNWFVVRASADTNGVSVSDDEVFAWIERNKVSFRQNATPSNVQLMKNSMSLLEYTEDEYWNHLMYLEGKEVLLKSKLFPLFATDYKSTHKDATDNEMKDAFEKELKDTADLLKVEKQ